MKERSVPMASHSPHRPWVPGVLGTLLLAASTVACGGKGQAARQDIDPGDAGRCTPGSDERNPASCSDSEVCSPSGYCVARCTDDSQCSAAERCDADSGLCVPRGSWPDAGARPRNACREMSRSGRSAYRAHCLGTDASPTGAPEWVECRGRDDDCEGVEGRPRCDLEMFRCMPMPSDTPSFCSRCETTMPECPSGYDCREQAPPDWSNVGTTDPTPTYCQPGSVVSTPDGTSCPAAGFQFLPVDPTTPRCVPHRHCLVLAAGFAELPCEQSSDCVPPGWDTASLRASLCPLPMDGSPRVCRIPCTPEMGSERICPPGWQCDAAGAYCERTPSGGGGSMGGDPSI